MPFVQSARSLIPQRRDADREEPGSVAGVLGMTNSLGPLAET